MTTFRHIWFLLAATFLAAASIFAADELKLAADEVTHAPGQKLTHAKGNVEIEYGTLRITCDEAAFNQVTSDVTARGNVVATQSDPKTGAVLNTWKTQTLHGNLNRQSLEFGPYRLDSEVWHIGGDGGDGSSTGDANLTSSWLTTCDRPQPHYTIHAKEIHFHQDDRTFTAWHVTLRVADVPVLYLPFLWGSTDNSAGLIVKPGYSGKRGYYLRLGRVWAHTALVNGKPKTVGSTQLFVDGMTKRGIALGAQTEYRTAERTVLADLYALHDRKPAETTPGWDRRFKSQDDRYRAHFYWREVLDGNWALRLNVDRLSDLAMLEDWYRHDYRHWNQPKSFLTLSYDNAWANAELTFRPRLNTFYTVSEKLPELRIDIPRLSLTGTDYPLLYASSTTAGFYSMKWRNPDRPRSALIPPEAYDEEIHGDPADYSAFRADTLHTLSAPIDADWLVLTPHASFRATSYSRTSRREISQEELADIIDADNPDRPRNRAPVVNYDRKGGARTRIATELGLDLAAKFFDDWSDLKSDLLQLDGIRHVLAPKIQYIYAAAPTVDRDHLYFFDETDRLERQHFLRLALDQRWQTRDAEGIRTLAALESYADLHFHRGEESGKYWGDLANRLTLQPRRDLSAWTAMLYDLGEGQIQRAQFGLRYGRKDDWNLALRYTYRHGHLSRSAYAMGTELADFFGESGYIKKHFESTDTISGTLNVPLNSLTSLEIHAEYDFEKSRMAEHHYYITRDLHCWTLVTGFGWDYNDFEFLILLRLTAFPNVKIDINI